VIDRRLADTVGEPPANARSPLTLETLTIDPLRAMSDGGGAHQPNSAVALTASIRSPRVIGRHSSVPLAIHRRH
jgi:hypothetical protein